MLNRILTSIGIGSAKVDTVLQKDIYQLGEMAKGVIYVEGGNIPQVIDEIYMDLMLSYSFTHKDYKIQETVRIGRGKAATKLTISPKEVIELPFEIQIPHQCPVSCAYSRFWIETGLDIKKAIDPKDRDCIQITQSDLMEAFFQAMYSLGFGLSEIDFEKQHPARPLSSLPFVQEFEFKPFGRYRRRFDEVEAVFINGEHELEVIVEVDRKVRGAFSSFIEKIGLDETLSRIVVTSRNVSIISSQIERLLH